MGVCTKERKGITAEVLMATPCTNSLGGERKVRFIENTAMRHRRGGSREVTVTSRHTDRKTKKDKERQKRK